MNIPIRDYWRLLRRYLNAQRTSVAQMSLLLLTGIGLQLGGPWVARSFISGVGAGESQADLIRKALLFLAVTAAAQVVGVLSAYWSDRVAWSASNALRLDLTDHLLRLDISFHKDRTPGELIERVDGDVSALGAFFTTLVVKLVGSLLLLAGVLISLFSVDLWLGLAFTLVTGAGMLALTRVRQVAVPAQMENRERSAGFYGYLGEVLSATEDVRSSGAVAHVISRFGEHIRGWYPVAVRSAVKGALIWVTALVMYAVFDTVAFGLGGSLFQLGAVTLGTVYMVVAYAGQLDQPIEMLRREMQNLQRADASIARIRALMETRSRLEDGTEVLPPGALPVELDHVSFRYDDGQADEYALRGVSFRLEAGRTLALLGRTGSGKSTLGRLLLRMYDPTEGAVSLGGVNLRSVVLQNLRERVGLVTQDVQLFEASLRDNITFFDPNVPDERILQVLEELGIRTWAERLPQGLETQVSASTLSAGEAQLLALARIFLKEPGLVVLDEPSSRLDPATEAVLDRAVRRLLAGRTAIIIAHRLATVQFVDEVLILEDGRRAERGAREDLAANPSSRFAMLHGRAMAEVLE